VVIPYRRFGTTCGPHFEGSKRDQRFVPKRRKGITTTGCKITLKRAVLMDMLSYEH